MIMDTCSSIRVSVLEEYVKRTHLLCCNYELDKSAISTDTMVEPCTSVVRIEKVGQFFSAG